MLASETILLSSVIAKRRKFDSSSPGWAIRPMRSIAGCWAMRLVTSAKRLRPLSVNWKDTTGCWFWSKSCLGSLMSFPDSDESSSITKKRLICGGWFSAGSPSTTSTPSGTL